MFKDKGVGTFGEEMMGQGGGGMETTFNYIFSGAKSIHMLQCNGLNPNRSNLVKYNGPNYLLPALTFTLWQ